MSHKFGGALLFALGFLSMALAVSSDNTTAAAFYSFAAGWCFAFGAACLISGGN